VAALHVYATPLTRGRSYTTLVDATVLEGRFTFTLGEEEREVEPGSWVLVPRGTRHGFTASADARALILVAPAGLEDFFAELGGGLARGLPTQEIRAGLKGRFDSIPA